MPDFLHSSSAISSWLAIAASSQKIISVFEERPNLQYELKSYSAVKSAALISGLLINPALQANTIRLELLVHLVLTYGTGKKVLNAGQVKAWLNGDLVNTTFASLEDPVEDVFLSNVTTEQGNFRIFEGTWENSAFYFQRILNVVNTLPDHPNANKLRREIFAALRLSDQIANRRKLNRFIMGGGQAKRKIRIPSLDRLKSLRRCITFSSADLESSGIDPVELAPFLLSLKERRQLADKALGNSKLQRHPIVYEAGKWFVMLPAAVSVAVRCHVLEWMASRGYGDSFNSHMAREYRELFTKTRILGAPPPMEAVMMSKRSDGPSILEFSGQVDTGRYLNVIAIVDSIEAYLKHGFSLPDPNVSELGDLIDQKIENARSVFTKQRDFKQGLTFLVGCGYGRPGVFRPPKESSDWWVEFVSAPDLETLSWILESTPLVVWKMLDNVRFLAQHDIFIENVNGLLNLYGWCKETDHLILPPEVEFGAGPTRIAIPTDCLAEVRRKIRQVVDTHVLPHPDGGFVQVSRESADSYFEDEAEKPNYISVGSALAGELRGAWIGESSVWWVEAESGATGLSRDLVFRIWGAVTNWLDKAVPVLEEFISDQTDPIILIKLNFNEAHQEQADPIPETELGSCLSVVVDHEKATIHIVFCDPFFGVVDRPKGATHDRAKGATWKWPF